MNKQKEALEMKITMMEQQQQQHHASAIAAWLVSPIAATISLAMLTVGLVLAVHSSRSRKSNKTIIEKGERHMISPIPIQGTKRLVGLGAAELQYIRLAEAQPGANRIYLIATIHGPKIARAKLEYAAQCIQRLHPLLRCRLVKANGAIVLEEDDRLRLNIQVAERYGPETCRQAFYNGAEKAKTEIGENAKSPHTLWLFQSSSTLHDGETQEIVLDLAHFAIDGAGLAPLMHEVLRYTLDDDLPLPSYGAWPIPQDIAIEAVLSSGRSWIAKYTARLRALLYMIWVAMSSEFLHLPRNDNLPGKGVHGLRNSTFCCRQTLDEKQTTKLIGNCKLQGVTVTSAVAAAYLEACAEARQQSIHRKIQATVSIVADSRKLYSPPAPVTDLSPHAYSVPLFATNARFWENVSNDAAFTWSVATEVRDHIKRCVLADPYDAACYASWIPMFFTLLPNDFKAPMLNVSSWCAGAPVQKTYNNGRFIITGVELLQNLAYNSWMNASVYTFVGKLNVSFLAPVPRFNERIVLDVFSRASKKLLALSQ